MGPLALALVPHLPGQRQHPLSTKQVGIATEFTSYVADDAAKIGLERLQGPVGALELLGVSVALMLDQRELAHAGIGLAQLDAIAIRQPDQDFAGAVEQPVIGRERDVLGLHRRVDDDAIEVGRLERLGLAGGREALLQQGSILGAAVAWPTHEP